MKASDRIRCREVTQCCKHILTTCSMAGCSQAVMNFLASVADSCPLLLDEISSCLCYHHNITNQKARFDTMCEGD